MSRLGLRRDEPIDVDALVGRSVPPDAAAELRALYARIGDMPVDVRVPLLLRRVEALARRSGGADGKSLATVKRRIAEGEAMLARWKGVGNERRTRAVGKARDAPFDGRCVVPAVSAIESKVATRFRALRAARGGRAGDGDGRPDSLPRVQARAAAGDGSDPGGWDVAGEPCRGTPAGGDAGGWVAGGAGGEQSGAIDEHARGCGPARPRARAS